MISKEIIKPWK